MNQEMKGLLSVCILICLSAVCRITEAAEQEYVVENEMLEPFDGDLQTFVEFTNLQTVGRQRYINGSMNFLEDMDDEHYKFSVELYSSPAGDGNYKRMAMDVPQIAICEGFKKFYVQFVQPSLQNGLNTDMPFVPNDGLCPFPSGTYYVKDIIFNTDEWPNQVPRGAVKAIVTFFKDSINVGGMTVIVKIEDR